MLSSSFPAWVSLLFVAQAHIFPHIASAFPTDVHRRASFGAIAINEINVGHYEHVVYPSFAVFGCQIIFLQASGYWSLVYCSPMATWLRYLDTAWTAVVRGKFKTNVIWSKVVLPHFLSECQISAISGHSGKHRSRKTISFRSNLQRGTEQTVPDTTLHPELQLRPAAVRLSGNRV